MAREPKKYEDDDGRVIADMSGVSRPNLLHLGGSSSKPSQPRRELPEEGKQDRPWEDTGMSREERRLCVWAALKAGLLIGLVYLVGLGLVAALLLWLWK